MVCSKKRDRKKISFREDRARLVSNLQSPRSMKLLQNLAEKIKDSAFPCIMAKAVMNLGYCEQSLLPGDQERDLAHSVFWRLNHFVDHYRGDKGRLHSFVVSFSHERFADFDAFEAAFWNVLRALRAIDDKHNEYDPRVSRDPEDPKFSFSIKGEAFFILLLHPQSPRKARRFALPAIVFNPHQQFEDLRAKGTFQKVRSLIRSRDEKLQGEVNPMLMDFGSTASEIYQYSGKVYPAGTACPLAIPKQKSA